jgi:dipeptidyl aminopeptidase/acylaminoacyl peptidase
MIRHFSLLVVALSTTLLLSGCSAVEQAQSSLPSLGDVLPSPPAHPLSIASLKARDYPGSEFVIERELPSTSNYNQFVVSYISDTLKIYGLLTIPKGNVPEGGWPAIIFNHGYIPPEQYRTTERYEAYVGGFANKGFVVFKPDYRGHGSSEGVPSGAYFSPGYTVDVLNALGSVRQLDYVNKDRIGMWGHSMGGSITLRAISVDRSIKAAVIWAGVVADYPQLINDWRRTRTFQPSQREQMASRSSRAQLIEQFGNPDQQNPFWVGISPWAELDQIETPIQLHHAKGDDDVPWEFSQSLHDKLQSIGKPSELFIYEGSNHNLSGATFSQAMNRSVQFFQKHL